MPQCFDNMDLTPIIANKETFHSPSGKNVEFKLVVSPDAWFDCAYRLLKDEFEVSTIDPRERYVEWLEMNRQGTHPFPYIMMLAYYVQGTNAVLAGCISGNIMRTAAGDAVEGGRKKNPWFFAIGHQLTVPHFRRVPGVRIGAALFSTALAEAAAQVDRLGGALTYTVAEAESDSIGFWSKQGFLWPHGMHYWQPPLVFDCMGEPLHSEVPEMFMLRPAKGVSGDSIGRAPLLTIVEVLYRNWCLAKYENVLSADAMSRAEWTVMDRTFGKVREYLPRENNINLVQISGARETSGTARRSRVLCRGTEHDLKPLKTMNLEDIGDFDDMFRAMKDMAFGARTLGEAVDVLYAMAADPDCKVVLTLSGAVTIAKLGLILSEMIDRGMVHCIISTGAILCHGFNEERGSLHFKTDDNVSDSLLFEKGYNRIYDTIETEFALDELEEIMIKILDGLPDDETLCSSRIVEELGKYLIKRGSIKGIIQSSYRNGIPVFIPAFTDSEIGLDFALYNRKRKLAGKKEIAFNPFLDLAHYSDFTGSSPKRGIITLGGGVPRNWAQQIGPYFDAIERREKSLVMQPMRFKYGVRICPDPHYWGGLSGSTYSEGISWGKFVPTEEGGQQVDVISDFTMVFPAMIKALFQRLDKNDKNEE